MPLYDIWCRPHHPRSSNLPHPPSSKFPCPNSPANNNTSSFNRSLRTLCYPFHISWKVLLLSFPQPCHHPSFAFVILFLSERLYYFLVTTSRHLSYLFVTICTLLSNRYFRIRKDHGASQPTDQPQIYVYLCYPPPYFTHIDTISHSQCKNYRIILLQA